MKIAALAAALVYLVSFVTADEPTTLDVGMTSDQAMTPGLRGTSPTGLITNTIDAKNNNVLVSKSNIVLSKSDRVQLAKVITEMLASHPEANRAAANLIIAQLEQDGGTSTVANLGTNRAVVSHAVNILASGISGNPAAAAGHTVGLISAAYPVVMAPAPRPVATRYNPSITITMSPSAIGIPPRTPPRFFPTSPSS
ncbi:hypothetical protein PI124_g15416 [Phytophthora idaei]|nr:hypothetical protein PI125_g15397 [Phytophthora idaei]KAG3143752.1 hypothetical protein PI126_g14468 [Phytophthora idaei]KAG3239652.1 hypothetical protein PI124_g15416 [Phytophthora idaei]